MKLVTGNGRFIRCFVNPSSIIAVRTHNTRRTLPAQSCNAKRFLRAWPTYRVTRSRIPRYTHEIRYRLREESWTSRGWGGARRDGRNEVWAIDRYRVPRTAALVDPSCLRTRQKKQSKIPRCLFSSFSSFVWHPILQRFFSWYPSRFPLSLLLT